MENIIGKSKRDLEKILSRPRVEDIISVKGFFKYFIYRNNLPFIRDLLFFIFDTAQIYLLFRMMGHVGSSGGILGYAFGIFISGFWTALIYSMRDKIISLANTKQHELIPNYFSSIVSSGAIVWILLVICSIFFFYGINPSPESLIIYSSKVLSQGIELYSSIYFFTIYTMGRIYIPFWLTIINRLFFLLLPIFLFRQLGVWSFVLAFFIERILNAIITIKYSNRSLKVLGIKQISSNFFLLAKKKLFWFFQDDPFCFLKKTLSFLLLNSQRLVFLVLVGIYYPYYLLDFFAFYQLINLFFLIPRRMSRSLFYDITSLLSRGRYYFMRLLANYNILLSLFFALVVVAIFNLSSFALPSFFSSIMLELTILNKWNSIYMLVFFSFGIIIINRVFIVSGSYWYYIVTTILFEYLILGLLIYNSDSFFKIGNPILVFSIQGELSLYYFFFILLLYISGLWKKGSIIRNESIRLNSVDDFLKTSRSSKNNLILVLFLPKKHSSIRRLENILELVGFSTKILSSLRVSKDILFLCIEDEGDQYHQELEIIGHVGVYCDKIILANKEELLSKLNAALEYRDFMYAGHSNLELAKDFLTLNKMEYSVHYNVFTSSSNRKKELYNILNTFEPNFAFIPMHLIFKKEYLGIVPIIEQGKFSCFIELNGVDIKLINELIRLLYLNELFRLASEIMTSK